METLESRLNFTSVEHTAPSHSVTLKANQSEEFYQQALNSYCYINNIDMSNDNCSAMIMYDYGAEAITEDGKEVFWFWIDS